MSKENITESVIDQLKNFAGLIGLIGGVSYIAGYLISNFYIGKFGISSFTLVQSRYFSTGGLFLILTTITMLGPAISLTIINISKEKIRNSFLKYFLLILFGILLSFTTIWYAGETLVRLNSSTNFLLPISSRKLSIWLGLTVTGIALMTPILLFYLAKWTYLEPKKNIIENLPTWSGLIFSGFIVFIFILGIWLFSEFVYPYVPSSFGGNAPTKAQIILSDYLANMEGYPIQNQNGISETLILIDQTPSSLIAIPATGDVVEIPMSEIKGIIR